MTILNDPQLTSVRRKLLRTVPEAQHHLVAKLFDHAAALATKYESLKLHQAVTNAAQARRVEWYKNELDALRKGVGERRALMAQVESLEQEINRLDNINVVIDRDRQLYQRLYEARLFRERSAS